MQAHEVDGQEQQYGLDTVDDFFGLIAYIFGSGRKYELQVAHKGDQVDHKGYQQVLEEDGLCAFPLILYDGLYRLVRKDADVAVVEVEEELDGGFMVLSV